MCNFEGVWRSKKGLQNTQMHYACITQKRHFICGNYFCIIWIYRESQHWYAGSRRVFATRIWVRRLTLSTHATLPPRHRSNATLWHVFYNAMPHATKVDRLLHAALILLLRTVCDLSRCQPTADKPANAIKRKIVKSHRWWTMKRRKKTKKKNSHAREKCIELGCGLGFVALEPHTKPSCRGMIEIKCIEFLPTIDFIVCERRSIWKE